MKETTTGPPPRPGARQGRSWGGIALRIALTIGVTWLVVSRVGVSVEELLSLDAALPAPRAEPLVFSALALLTGFFVSARLWGWMAGELGGKDPGWLGSIRIWMAANLGRYLPGKIWQMAGLALLARRVGIPAAVAGTAGALGQTFALAAAAILSVPVLAAPSGGSGAAGPALLVVLFITILLASIPSVLRGLLSFVFRVARIPAEDLPRTSWTFGPRWLLRYMLNWAIYGFAFVLFMEGLGLPGAFLPLAGAFAAAYLLGYAAVFAPAGLGVREGFLIAFLRPEIGSAAVGVAVLARVWMTLVEVVPAGAVGLWEVFRRDDVRRTGSSDGTEAG